MTNEEQFQQWLAEHKNELESAVYDQFMGHHFPDFQTTENPCSETVRPTAPKQPTPLTTNIFYGIVVLCFVYLVICILTHCI
jgi:hypothetical protein